MLNAPTLTSPVPGTPAWWADVLWHGQGLALTLVLLATVGVGVVAWRAVWNTRLRGELVVQGPRQTGTAHRRRAVKRVLKRLHGDSGVATVEFVLVFPVALMTVLVLLQTTLMMAGNVFVHYAAFVGARSAIVQAPTGARGGGGALTQGGDGPKWQAVERSAAFAMAPVSGKINDGAEGERLASGLRSMYGGLDAEVPGWVDSLAGQRLNYALAHTEAQLYYTRVRRGNVDFVEVGNGATIQYNPKSPVTVGVTHKLHLSIPYASVLFSGGTHATAGGTTHYSEINATSTLTLEGYDRNLPEAPPVDRDP